MNYAQENQNDTSSTKSEQSAATPALRERVDTLRHVIENVRDQAEIVFKDKPYLLPVATGALGVGIGVLLGSKLTRFILFTAVGTLLTDSLGGEIKRISQNFIHDMQERLGYEEPEPAE